jgi:hypothetical protein
MQRVTDTELVRSVVENYITASKTGDGELLRSIFHPNAVMFGHLGDQLFDSSPEGFFQMAAGAPQGDAYQATILSVEVFGSAATACIAEDGFAGFDFIDCFHLLNVDGRWLITAKLFNHDR